MKARREMRSKAPHIRDFGITWTKWPDSLSGRFNPPSPARQRTTAAIKKSVVGHTFCLRKAGPIDWTHILPSQGWTYRFEIRDL